MHYVVASDQLRRYPVRLDDLDLVGTLAQLICLASYGNAPGAPHVTLFVESKMKRFRFYFLFMLIAFSVGGLTLLPRAYKSIVSQAPNITPPALEFPCPPDSFTLKRQPEATLRLNIDRKSVV